jgi:hypothetical protein
MYLEFSMVAKLAMLEQQFLAVPDESNKYFWIVDVTIWCAACGLLADQFVAWRNCYVCIYIRIYDPTMILDGTFTIKSTKDWYGDESASRTIDLCTTHECTYYDLASCNYWANYASVAHTEKRSCMEKKWHE